MYHRECKFCSRARSWATMGRAMGRANEREKGEGDKRTNGRTDEGGKEGDRNGWASEHNEVLILQLVDPSIALDVVSVVRADERSDNNVILIPSIFFANAPIVVTYMHIPPLKVHIYAYNICMYIHVYLSPSIFTGREKYSGREAALYRRSLSRGHLHRVGPLYSPLASRDRATRLPKDGTGESTMRHGNEEAKEARASERTSE